MEGAQTYVDMLSPYKGMREHGWNDMRKVRRDSTVLLNTERDLHATWIGTGKGIEELGDPGGPRWSPVRKKHLQGVGLPNLALPRDLSWAETVSKDARQIGDR